MKTLRTPLLLLKPILSLALIGCVFTGFAQTHVYADPNIPKPTHGFGQDGPNTTATTSCVNPSWPSHPIMIYHPTEITTPVPTIFYCHGFGGSDPANVSGMIEFVTSKGYCLVFVPYSTQVSNAVRYADMLKGFRRAARQNPGIIDTTRVGFLGYSFGGGASFHLAHTAFTENGWGSQGRFLYALAPWYALEISQDQLVNFPSDTKVLVEVFEADTNNDHRMAIDLFKTIGVPTAEKDFLLVRGDTLNGYVHAAEHSLPNMNAFDALDYYAYYRLLAALCDYTWTGSAAAKKVALGGGHAWQTTMPTGMKPLVETDPPVPAYPESKYRSPCSSPQNPREQYCSSPDHGSAGPGPFGGDLPMPWPVPAGNTLNMMWPPDALRETAYLVDMLGRPVRQVVGNGDAKGTFDLTGLPSGPYVLLLHDQVYHIIKE